jgi:hypothetical protein
MSIIKTVNPIDDSEMYIVSGVVEVVKITKLDTPDKFQNTHKASLKIGDDWVNVSATLDLFLSLIPSPTALTFPSQGTGEISYKQYNVMGDSFTNWNAQVYAYRNIAPGKSRK